MGLNRRFIGKILGFTVPLLAILFWCNGCGTSFSTNSMIPVVSAARPSPTPIHPVSVYEMRRQPNPDALIGDGESYIGRMYVYKDPESLKHIYVFEGRNRDYPLSAVIAP